MTVASNRSGLRWLSEALAISLVTGLFVLLVLAAASCGGAEPDKVDDTLVTDLTATSVATPVKTELPGGATWVLESLDGGSIVDESFVTLNVDGDSAEWL